MLKVRGVDLFWPSPARLVAPGQPRAVGKSQKNHNLLPITGRLIEGELLTVQAVRVEMKS